VVAEIEDDVVWLSANADVAVSSRNLSEDTGLEHGYNENPAQMSTLVIRYDGKPG
jgi:hypothetical protein